MRTRKKVEWDIDSNGCFVVTSHCLNCVYPQKKVNGKMVRLHRLYYEAAHGPIPDALVVRHLLLGTQGDNIKDREQRRRGFFKSGSLHPRSKLNDKQVMEILADQTTPASILGNKYQVSRRTIRNIRDGVSWKHLHEQEPETLRPR